MVWFDDFGVQKIEEKQIVRDFVRQELKESRETIDWNCLAKAMTPVLIKDGTIKSEEEFKDLMNAIEVAEILCPDDEIEG